jgi:hypothetical protein
MAAATNADAVERLNVLGPPPVPTMLTVRRGGGSGRGLRSFREPSSVLARVQALAGQSIPEVAPDLLRDRVALRDQRRQRF